MTYPGSLFFNFHENGFVMPQLIVQYLTKQRQPDNEMWLINRI